MQEVCKQFSTADHMTRDFLCVRISNDSSVVDSEPNLILFCGNVCISAADPHIIDLRLTDKCILISDNRHRDVEMSS